MKFITPKIHGIIDVLIFLFLLSSPVLFGFTGTLAGVIYAFGVIHLILTMITDFNIGLVKLVPFDMHETAECIIAISSIVLAYTLFNHNASGKLFFVTFGNCLLLTWLVTNYKGQSVKELSSTTNVLVPMPVVKKSEYC